MTPNYFQGTRLKKIWVDFTGYPSNQFSGYRLNGRLLYFCVLYTYSGKLINKNLIKYGLKILTVLCTCYLRQNVQVQQIGKADDVKMARRALSSFPRRKQWRRNVWHENLRPFDFLVSTKRPSKGNFGKS